jgi:hypothetical protein
LGKKLRLEDHLKKEVQDWKYYMEKKPLMSNNCLQRHLIICIREKNDPGAGHTGHTGHTCRTLDKVLPDRPSPQPYYLLRFRAGRGCDGSATEDSTPFPRHRNETAGCGQDKDQITLPFLPLLGAMSTSKEAG